MDKAEREEYQTKCEILMDLCLDWLDRYRVISLEDYDNLMTDSQAKYDKQDTSE